MQGSLFIWHNCIDGNRSLWKRLDRMLVNDRWLDRWPNAAYTSLPPRTFDHSPWCYAATKANPPKTQLILSKSAHGNREALLQLLGFQEDEGGLGVCDVQALNYALMGKHMWAVISNRDSSTWVQWVWQYRIKHKTVWMVNANAGSWCWRKLLWLRVVLHPQVEYRIGDGVTFFLWQDPWHALGSLIHRFSSGP
ncbi:UNVERIFIED_CONTAM: hypothetical protein Slati_4471700 [Sesamum latifolium]|uniref:Reverse transcriptase zinc-binding domain-containing protein n=1 Tax=Sesamum latifolium TaxID=2727402 RepID=A0AAW2SSD2_9LAMI